MAFSAEWLALREAADRAARDSALLVRAAGCVAPGQHVLDLGCGTGSTARAFAGQGFKDLHWRFLDSDRALLDVAGRLHPDAEVVQGDLADVDALPLADVGLVTASALLDLMPLAWVQRLAARLSAARIPFYAALSYDGQMRWSPPMDADACVTEYFNRHQGTDKGLGPALGPLSAAGTVEAFTAEGFSVSLSDSPWVIGLDQAAFHDALLEGIGAAAAEAGLQEAADWAQARRAAVDRSQGVIGHRDLLACLPAEHPDG